MKNANLWTIVSVVIISSVVGCGGQVIDQRQAAPSMQTNEFQLTPDQDGGSTSAAVKQEEPTIHELPEGSGCFNQTENPYCRGYNWIMSYCIANPSNTICERINPFMSGKPIFVERPYGEVIAIGCSLRRGDDWLACIRQFCNQYEPFHEPQCIANAVDVGNHLLPQSDAGAAVDRDLSEANASVDPVPGATTPPDFGGNTGLATSFGYGGVSQYPGFKP